MAFIDLLINETTEKFGLGTTGIAVVSALVSTMNEPSSGGIEGFINRFRQAGWTEHVNAWLQNEAEPLLVPQQLEAALESATLQHLADKAGLPIEKATEVIAFLVPLLVGHLAARKAVFSSQPDEIRQALWSNQIEPPQTDAISAVAPFSLHQFGATAKSRGMKWLRALSFL